jgi:hypothetical protein
MKRFVSEFIRRGLIACGLGPIVLSVIYLIFSHFSAMEVLRVSEVCTGIFSLSALAFIAGGMNTIYQIERLPLMAAIFIHGGVLYIGYLCTYLLNDWLALGSIPILVFSGIFIVGYFVIWAIIYIIIKKNTEKINQILKTKQQNAENL